GEIFLGHRLRCKKVFVTQTTILSEPRRLLRMTPDKIHGPSECRRVAGLNDDPRLAVNINIAGSGGDLAGDQRLCKHCTFQQKDSEGLRAQMRRKNSPYGKIKQRDLVL